MGQLKPMIALTEARKEGRKQCGKGQSGKVKLVVDTYRIQSNFKMLVPTGTQETIQPQINDQ